MRRRNRALMRRSFKALPSGGAVVNQRASRSMTKRPAGAGRADEPQHADRDGRTKLHAAEYSAWLEEAGFRHIETVWFDAPAANAP